MKKFLVFSALIVFLAAGNAFALSLNSSVWTDITTYDLMGSNTYFGTDTRTTTHNNLTLYNPATNTYSTILNGAAVLEDQETETNTISNQSWDLEGIFLNSSTNQVALVGGYNFLNNSQTWNPGDIFISVDKTVDVPASNPNAVPEAPVYPGTRNYEIVLSIDYANATYDVYDSTLTPAVTTPWGTKNVWYNTVGNPGAGGSPWRIDNPVVAAAAVDKPFQFTNSVDVADSGLQGTGRYALVFDLNDIFGDIITDQLLYIHYTMECGNDSMAGFVENYSGTPPVPEPATLILLGTGLVGVAGVGRRKFAKKA